MKKLIIFFICFFLFSIDVSAARTSIMINNIGSTSCNSNNPGYTASNDWINCYYATPNKGGYYWFNYLHGNIDSDFDTRVEQDVYFLLNVTYSQDYTSVILPSTLSVRLFDSGNAGGGGRVTPCYTENVTAGMSLGAPPTGGNTGGSFDLMVRCPLSQPYLRFSAGNTLFGIMLVWDNNKVGNSGVTLFALHRTAILHLKDELKDASFIATQNDIYNALISIQNNNQAIVNATQEQTDAIKDNTAEQKRQTDYMMSDDAPSTDMSSLGNVQGLLPAGPIDSLLNLPFTTVGIITNSLAGNCVTVSAPLPFLDTNLDIPCFNETFYGSGMLSQIINYIGIIPCAFILISYFKVLYKKIDRAMNMETSVDDEWGVI